MNENIGDLGDASPQGKGISNIVINLCHKKFKLLVQIDKFYHIFNPPLLVFAFQNLAFDMTFLLKIICSRPTVFNIVVTLKF